MNFVLSYEIVLTPVSHPEIKPRNHAGYKPGSQVRIPAAENKKRVTGISWRPSFYSLPNDGPLGGQKRQNHQKAGLEGLKRGCFVRMVRLGPSHSVSFGLKWSQSVIFHGLSLRKPYEILWWGPWCAFFLRMVQIEPFKIV